MPIRGRLGWCALVIAVALAAATAVPVTAGAEEPTVPSAPLVPMAVPHDQEAQVFWVAPTSDGGSPITGYEVTSTPGGLTCFSAGGSWCAVTGLTNGVSYTFTVRAVNLDGPGPASEPTEAVVPRTFPGAPRNVVAQEEQGIVYVSWDPPANTGGLPVSFYEVEGEVGGGFAGDFCSTAQTQCAIPWLNPGWTYTFVVRAFTGAGAGPVGRSNPVVYTAGEIDRFGFHPVVPKRLFDTRGGTGGVGTAKVGRQRLRVIMAGRHGMPQNLLGAVSLNVTVRGAEEPGFLTVFPCGTRPLVSSVNYRAGQTVANAVVVPVSEDGAVCFYAERPVHVIADLNGWFPLGMGLRKVSPTRLFDTRNGAGMVDVGRVEPGLPLKVKVTGRHGVAATGVGLVSLNVTATGGEQAGFVTVYPCGNRPNASSVNYLAGQTVANAVLAPVSADGYVCFYAERPVHVLADVNAWFPMADAWLKAVPPARWFDTRDGTGGVDVGRVEPGSPVRLKVTGQHGIPASGVGAVSLNLTVTGGATAGFVTVYPCGARPLASNVNYLAGQTKANAVLAPVSAAGEVCFYAETPVHVLADLNGWFSR